MLREKDVVVAGDKALATLMNNYFVNITADLDLKRDREKFCHPPASVYNIKKKFQDHQSILKIKKAFNVTDLFSFHEITEDEIRKEISKLDGSEATPIGDIPAEMLKSTTDVLCLSFNKNYQLIYPKWMFSRRIESCRSYPNL